MSRSSYDDLIRSLRDLAAHAKTEKRRMEAAALLQRVLAERAAAKQAKNGKVAPSIFDLK